MTRWSTSDAGHLCSSFLRLTAVSQLSKLLSCKPMLRLPKLFLLLFVLLHQVCRASVTERDQDWPNVGNDKGGMRYSKLAQINHDNVRQLQVAWTYHTGDAAKGNGTTIECTPIDI